MIKIGKTGNDAQDKDERLPQKNQRKKADEDNIKKSYVTLNLHRILRQGN